MVRGCQTAVIHTRPAAADIAEIEDRVAAVEIAVIEDGEAATEIAAKLKPRGQVMLSKVTFGRVYIRLRKHERHELNSGCA